VRWKPLGVDSRLSSSARADIWFPEEDVTMAIATTNPVTGEVLKEFDELRPEELEDKLSRAAAAGWPVRPKCWIESPRP
jgi:acyl-CoA reductase-like NAD-dependent aldehyde dehydrogenase